MSVHSVIDHVMSDVSEGPGWWQASDGFFYPPEAHPSSSEPTVSIPVLHQFLGRSQPVEDQASGNDLGRGTDQRTQLPPFLRQPRPPSSSGTETNSSISLPPPPIKRYYLGEVAQERVKRPRWLGRVILVLTIAILGTGGYFFTTKVLPAIQANIGPHRSPQAVAGDMMASLRQGDSKDAANDVTFATRASFLAH